MLYTQTTSKFGFWRRRLPLTLTLPASLKLLNLCCFGNGKPGPNSGRFLAKFPNLEGVWVYLLLLSIFFTSSLLGDSVEEQAIRKLQSGQYKAAIQLYQKLALNAPVEKKGEYLKQLAKTYFLDQEQVKAIETFLKSLEATAVNAKAASMNEDEKLFYEEALRIYRDPREREPKEQALKLRDLYGGVERLHPEYYHLRYIVALAYANLGNFDHFFDLFYGAYQHLPEHYLAYKTQAILHIKLFERAASVNEKERERREVLNYIEKAKTLDPLDGSLYRIELGFVSEKEKPEALERNINQLLSEKIVVSRNDLSVYFDKLFEYGKYDLAAKLLEKARSWYPYSRTLDAAEEMLKNHGN